MILIAITFAALCASLSAIGICVLVLLLAARLLGLTLSPTLYWSSVCLLALPATRLARALLAGFDPPVTSEELALTQLGAAISYGLIGVAWLGGLIGGALRPVRTAFTPALGLALGGYVLVLVGLLLAPTAVRLRQSAGRAALSQAVLASDLDLVRREIEAGGDPGYYYPELGGRSVMSYALANGQAPLVELLLDLGPRGSHNPLLALPEAAGYDSPALVALFLARGADVEQGVGAPLRAAVEAGHSTTTAQLLEAGANPNTRSPVTRLTSLMIAASSVPPRPDLVELLLRYGADRSLRDDYGATAAEIAEAAGQSALADLLRSP